MSACIRALPVIRRYTAGDRKQIIVFHSLSREDISRILDLQLKDIEKRLSETHRLSIRLTEEARNYLISKGYQPKYGARPLKRLLQSEIEDLLAEEILRGSVQDSDTVTISVKDGRITLCSAKE